MKIIEDESQIAYYTDDYILHREDGPAVIYYLTGDKFWFFNGKSHRLDGPASEFGDGGKEWFYCGIFIPCKSQYEFEKYIKLLTFL